MPLRLSIVLLTVLVPILMIGQQIELNLFSYSPYNDGSCAVNKEAIVKLNEDFVDSFVSLVPKPPVLTSAKSHSADDLISFKRLHFLSPAFSHQYEQSYGSRPPNLFSHVEQGSSLVNILTYSEPIMNYHSSEGNYNLTYQKSAGSIWSRQLSSRSIENFCSTEDHAIDLSYKSVHHKSDADSIPTTSVYLEIDYHTYQDFGGDLQAINDWAIILFSEVAAVYAIDEIPIRLEEIFVWESEDIYDLDLGPFSVLDQFDYRILNDGPSADAHLFLSTRYIAGVANLGSLCAHENESNPMAAAGIATGLDATGSFNPNFNWSVYIMAHELGHILGSRHTHACVWIDGTQAIDDCAAPEGDCNRGSRPGLDEGTIMSYCHRWQSIGIDFTNGLGTEPAELIKSFIRENTCDLEPSCEIGNLCDDGDSCSVNDRIINEHCACTGDLIDFNFNNICDMDEQCPESLIIDTISNATEGHIAQLSIECHTSIESNQTVFFSAANEINLTQGFEVQLGALFESNLYGCDTED